MKKFKKKVLIFDVDGVLIDSKKNMELSWKKVQKKHSLNHVEFESYFKNIGRPFFKILNILGINKDLKKIKETYQQESTKQIKEIKFIKNIMNNFTYIECNNDMTRGKPFPDQINLIISKLKVDKAECVYIGDTLVDYHSAKNAKIDFIFAKWGYGINYNYKYKSENIKNLNKLIIRI